MRITNKKQIYLVTVLANCVALSIVLSIIMLIYPREDWLWELSLSGVLTVSITTSMVYLFAEKLYENNLLNEELKRLVNRDRLTDVATRDFFFDRMERDPEAYGVSLMVDIDHFKQVNDSYGHLVGDEVIKVVGKILRNETRAQDIVCRFGGEEFVIFLHEADGDKGLLVAERMRMSIAASEISAGEEAVSVTVSIGGSLKDRMDDINVSIKLADEALYRAKTSGRNRTVVDWMPSGLNDLPKAG